MKTGGRFSSQHPLAPQFGVRPEVDLVGKEYLGPGSLGLLPRSGILCHEGLPLRLIRLDQALLGPLEGKFQPVQSLPSWSVNSNLELPSL